MARGTTLKIDIVADGSRADRVMDRTGRAAGKLGKAMAVGLAVGVGAAVALGVEVVKSASRVEQAVGGAEAVFGKYATGVTKSASKAALAVGLSKGEYLDLANVIGSQLRNAGTSMDALGPKTDKLIGLGADLAAQFGGSTSDAVAAVSSLLKGETDPIERYGVSIKQSDINARLAAQGLDKLTGKAAKQAQATAALALLTEQTASAHGAFNREAGTVANTQQKLTALWENGKAVLGSALLPILATLGEFLLTTVVPAVQRLWAEFGPKLMPVLTQVAGVLSTSLVPVLRGLWAVIGPQLLPILAALAGFITGQVVPAIARLWRQIGPVLIPAIASLVRFVRGTLLPVFLALAGFIVQRVVPVVGGILTKALGGLRQMFATVQAAVERNRPALNTLFSILGKVAGFILGTAGKAIGTVLAAAFKTVGHVISGTLDGLSSFVGWIKDAVAWVQRLIDKLSNSKVGKVLAGGLSRLTGSMAGPAVTAARHVASVAVAAASPSTMVPVMVAPANHDVRVYLGDRELTDIVRVEVDRGQSRTARRIASGVRP